MTTTPKYVHHFSSLDSFVEYASGPTDMAHESRSSRRTSNGDWTLCRTYDEAAELALKGWDKPRADVDATVANVLPQIRESLPDQWVPFFDVTGAVVDIGAFMTGAPECMIDFQSQPVASHGKVVTILAGISCSACVDVEETVAKGTAIVALVDSLAKLGHTVRVFVESHCGEITHLVCLKDAGDPLDLDALMFGIGHPDMFRRLMFSAEERESAQVRRANGIPGGYSGQDNDWGYLTQADAIGADICIPSNNYMRKDAKDDRFTRVDSHDPAGWVKRQLVKMGLLDAE
jgi:hypothetical protein